MDKPKIILIGGGGHCVSSIDVIEQENKFEIAGILDNEKELHSNVLNYPIIGTDDDIEKFHSNNMFFLITVGQIKNTLIRERIAQKLNGKNIATVISPLAYVSKNAIIQKGTIIMHKAIINALANVGKHCIINTLANIEHGVIIKDFCHISTGAMINGDCIINEKTFIGSNATIAQSVEIKSNSIISAGKFIK